MILLYLSFQLRRNPFFVHSKRQQIQIDLADVSKYSQWNQGTRFLLAGIDVFSRYEVAQ